MIYDNPAYVTAEKLAFVMNYSTLQTLCKRNRAIRVRRACRGVVALYDIRALPERWRIKVYEAFPETCPTRSVCLLMDGLQSSEDAKLWFFDYTLPTGKHLSHDKVLELANNAAILEQCTRVFDAVTAARARFGKKNPCKKLWQTLAESLEELEKCGWRNSLPRSGDRLQKKWNEYQAKGYTALIGNRFCNQHARKLDESFFSDFIADLDDKTDTEICDIYNDAAEIVNWKTIKVDTVTKLRQRNNIDTGHGKSNKGNSHQDTI